MYLNKIPRIFSFLFKDLTTYIKKSNNYYLTFDDGPFLETTPLILDKLKELNIKATFFCSGKQIENHKHLYNNIIEDGHCVGNHGYAHQNGWKTTLTSYLDDVTKAKKLINNNLFRPPYGKLTLKQYHVLKKTNKIILWDNMPGDFDKSLSIQSVISNFKKNLKPGSIIVLHDNPKSLEKCMSILNSLNKNEITREKFDTLNCLL